MPTKKVKTDENDAEKENIKPTEEVKIDLLSTRPKLDLKTAIFAMDLFKTIYVPGIVIGFEVEDPIYLVKYFCGREERLGRKYVHSPEDKEFYSLTTISLKNVLNSTQNVMIRPFNKHNIVKMIEDGRDEMMKILKGELESERDLNFLSGIQRRSIMNSGNRPGPFTLEEYNFLLEYFPNVLIPSLLKNDVKLQSILAKRFDKTGSSLDHLLRQYSYLVLVPEFTIRRILKIDETVKNYTEANEKFLNDLEAYDGATGNFINYLYSKKEMYQYAYREKRSALQE